MTTSTWVAEFVDSIEADEKLYKNTLSKHQGCFVILGH